MSKYNINVKNHQLINFLTLINPYKPNKLYKPLNLTLNTKL